MTKLKNKLVATTLLVSAVSMTSFAANANEVSFEKALANLVIAQGKTVVSELSTQVEQSIQASLSNFSIQDTINTLVEVTENTELLASEKATNNKNSSFK